jgi:cytochrome c peroxidase
LRLFIGAGNCLQCHHGPLLANHDFHATGTPLSNGVFADPGRSEGIPQVLEDPFNCLGPYSDAAPEDCGELRFMAPSGPEHVGAFKTPTLRNVADTAPYMHAGQLETLEDVMAHYNEAPTGPHDHTDLFALNLSDAELRQLVAFLRTLSGPVEAP